MRHYPIFLNLHGATVLVIGAGEAADRRAAAFAAAGATLRRATRFAPALLDGCALAAGADADPVTLQALSAMARARGIPVNIVDRPELCSYFTPSIIDRDPLTVAVGSGGAAPLLARLLRSRIEAWLAPGYGGLARFAERFAPALRIALPDLAPRRRLLERILGGRVADLVLAGDEAAAAAEFEAEIAAAAAGRTRASAGIVYLVETRAEAADLLTLRAQRLLGEADVILHDPQVSAEVLAMARRDATRITAADRPGELGPRPAETAPLLIRLAREGHKVVRLAAGDPAARLAEAAALEAAGVAYAQVPGVTDP